MENLTQIWTLNTIQDKTHSNLSHQTEENYHYKKYFLHFQINAQKRKKEN